jgi:hypothetical protein
VKVIFCDEMCSLQSFCNALRFRVCSFYVLLFGIQNYKFHIIFTVHSVLYNSSYLNQHMHYTFVVIYAPTYVSTTY